MEAPAVGAMLVFSVLLFKGTSATIFTFKNNCPNTVWPATLSGATSPALSPTGFELAPGAAATLVAQYNWSGRMWARTSCSTDTSGRFTCVTGDCGSGRITCDGAGGAPPATLVEFTLNGADGKDFYDLSLVDGFNVPVSLAPEGGAGAGAAVCSAVACGADVNAVCPQELVVVGGGDQKGTVVGCKSACMALGNDEYCCTGAFGSPDTCKPTAYSKILKERCPQAYSYPYDDATSTFTCVGADYVVVFCP